MSLPPLAMISRFESLLEGALLPEPQVSRLLHENCHPLQTLFPEKRLLSFLSRSSLLALRLVSITTKIWVESGPRSAFSNLYLPFPCEMKECTSNTGCNSQYVSEMCEKLTVKLAASKMPLTTAVNIFGGPLIRANFPSLRSLHIIAPPADAFWPLLEFRLYMQAIDLPLLTRFAIDGLSIEGVKALRWGPMTSYIDGDGRSSVTWKHLTNLDISLTPLVGFANLPESKEGIQAVKILHDWIASFGENTFEKVRYIWLGENEGPNPFLLENVPGMCECEQDSMMPSIKWKGCQEIWLGGVSMGTEDLKDMANRVKGLKRVAIWTSMLGREVKEGERKLCSRGKEWVMIEVEGFRESRMDLAGDIVDQDDNRGRKTRESLEETSLQEVPEPLFEDWRKDQLGEGHCSDDGEATRLDDADADADALSDTSREIPIFLDEATHEV